MHYKATLTKIKKLIAFHTSKSFEVELQGPVFVITVEGVDKVDEFDTGFRAEIINFSDQIDIDARIRFFEDKLITYLKGNE